MKIAVLGTGVVGRTIARGLARNGHDVVIGTRDPVQTMARTETDQMGNPPYAAWREENTDIGLQAYSAAAQGAELLVNATGGSASLIVLADAGPQNLAGKVLIDVCNPLDFSHGFPPTLSVCNTDSVAEQIQRTYPSTKVVKSLNTINARLMTEPSLVPGEHSIFVAGDDDEAKKTVRDILRGFGWPDGRIIDVGDIRAARGLEMYLPLWLTLMQTLGTPDFNIEVRRA
jgi:8-hydroxy-5-deazaflavin:NADPH oxidoreductase